ncbi:MAG: chorismate-binding protein [Candidatus Thermoplasmatota archaeon]|nr:chorismate-binding protein [Candidatus Thermoplasmatota archaeon]
MKSGSSLIEEIGSHGDVAYFCFFDEVSRLEGREILVRGSGYVEMNRGDRNFLQASVNRILSGEGAAYGIAPVYVGYDYASEVFPELSLTRSAWPIAIAMIPSEVRRGTFCRQEDSARGHRTVPMSASLDELPIEELRDRIRGGELLQCVISKEFPIEGVDVHRYLERFLNSDRSSYVFYFRFGKYEVLGSSPENLVSMTNRELKMKPIAGTRPRRENNEEDMELAESLRNDEKELLEHRMLVDLARNDLGRISMPGSVRVTRSMEVQKFATVQHLVSTVESTREERYTVDDVLRAVFPAGTVSGAPKRRAVELINKYEKTPRGPYAGCIGLAGKGYLDLALTIRTVYGIGGRYSVRAGAGIVKDSIAEKEQQEILAKAASATGGA